MHCLLGSISTRKDGSIYFIVIDKVPFLTMQIIIWGNNCDCDDYNMVGGIAKAITFHKMFTTIFDVNAMMLTLSLQSVNS